MASTALPYLNVTRSELWNSYRAPVPIDGSSDSEFLSVSTSSSSEAATTAHGVSAINHQSANVNWYDTVSQSVRLDRSYIQVTMKGWRVDPLNPDVPLPVATGTTTDDVFASVPWHTGAALIEYADVSFNDFTRPIEEYSSNGAGESFIVNALAKYSKDVLDDQGDCFFTPCIESSRDNVTSLSLESQQRALNHFQGPDATGSSEIKLVKKNIYLSQLFDSCGLAAVMPIYKLRLNLRFKPSGSIFFKASASGGGFDTAEYYLGILSARLWLCYERPTGWQDKLTKGMNMKDPIVCNYTYMTFGTTTQSYIGDQDIIVSGVRSLQGAVAAIKSTKLPDGVGVNPYQYCFLSNTGLTSTITSFQMRYAGIMSPQSSVQIDLMNPKTNSSLYTLFRNTVGKELFPTIRPSLPSNAMLRDNRWTGADLVVDHPYGLMSAAFYPTDMLPHLELGGADLVLMLKGGSGQTVPIQIVKICTASVKIDNSGAIETIP